MNDKFESIERAYKGHMKGVERKKLREALKARRREKAAEAARNHKRDRSRFRTVWTDLVETEADDTQQERRSHRGNGRGSIVAAPRGPATPPHQVQFGDGIVVAVSPRGCIVLVEDREIPCTLAEEIRARQQSEVAVGDRAAVEVRPNGRGVVRFVHEPDTVLTRPDPLIPGRVRRIASNVDAVAIVVSVIAPPLRVRLIDRILIAVQRGGARPMLLVNKIDLLPPEGEDDLVRSLDPYIRLGIEVRRVSAATGTGVEELRQATGRRTILFCGHSGVGKTSLLNAIHPEFGLATSEVSAFSSKGVHTTTSSRLYVLPSGGRIIDSPGMRQFGIDSVGRKNLSWYFPEFEPLREDCRYSNCTHEHEPSCAVREAARTGAIHPARYETYLRILESLQ